MRHPNYPAFLLPRDRPLTEKQLRTLRLVRESIEFQGEPPSIVVMARRLKTTETGVTAALAALTRKGFITMDGVSSRTVQLTAKGLGEK